MPKGKATPAAAQQNKSAGGNSDRPNGKRWKNGEKGAREVIQKAAASGNRHEVEHGGMTPWQTAKAKRAERRKGMPMSTASRQAMQRREKNEASKAERDSDAKNKSSLSQARRNADMIARALERKNGALGDGRKDKTPQPIAAV